MKNENETAAANVAEMTELESLRYSRDEFTVEKWTEIVGDEAKAREAHASFIRNIDRSIRICEAGLKVRSRKHLVRLSNVRTSCGRLQDATCHYEMQVVVEGETWPHRAMLKAIGLRWDRGDKVWYRPFSGTMSHMDELETVRDAIDNHLPSN